MPLLQHRLLKTTRKEKTLTDSTAGLASGVRQWGAYAPRPPKDPDKRVA